MAAGRAQSTVALEPFQAWTFPDGAAWTLFYRVEAGYLLRFPDLADFVVSADGQTVTCHPTPEAPATASEHLYLNQVLPLVLSKQGKPVFHASAVELADSAVAFLGESGRGKSTLAASFARAGARFLTDDGLVLEEVGAGQVVLPSHPSIRLWEDSETALIAPGLDRAPELAFTSKSRFLFADSAAFCAQPRPLRRVYFLGDGSATAPTFVRMTAAEALIELVKHSFLLDVEEKPRLASHFEQVTRLARRPIHFRLDYPRRFDQLADVRQAIVDHAQREDETA